MFCIFIFGGNVGCLIVLICNYSCIVFIFFVCVWIIIYNGLDILKSGKRIVVLYVYLDWLINISFVLNCLKDFMWG